MSIQWAPRNGEVELAYEAFGSPGGEPLLLISGNSCQMVWWPEGFCEALAARGFHVVRFDNRDYGLSTHFTSPELRHPGASFFRGEERAYGSADLTDDAVAVMDAVGWESAHLLGASSGGMIAQHTTLRHAHRVRTLSCLSSAPGTSAWKMLRYFNISSVLRMLPSTKGMTTGGDRDAYVRATVQVMRFLNTGGRPFDEELVRGLAELSHDRRPLDPTSSQRHASASLFRGDLGEIGVPTLVLHGTDDPILRISGGRAIAKAVPDARMVAYAGMGHFMPPGLWASITDEVRALARTSVGR